MPRKRKSHTAALKAQVALAAVKGDKTIRELAALHGVNPKLIHAWKKQLLDSAENLALMALIDREYTAHPFLGGRGMWAWLRREGHQVNRKRVQRPGGQRHRRTFDRVMPWLDARQQSQPPFHPARRRYRKCLRETRSTELPVRKAGKSVAKERPFFVQKMGSTSA